MEELLVDRDSDLRVDVSRAHDERAEGELVEGEDREGVSADARVFVLGHNSGDLSLQLGAPLAIAVEG